MEHELGSPDAKDRRPEVFLLDRPFLHAAALTIAGLAVWAFAAVFPSIGMMVMNLFPTSLLWISIVWTLFEYPLATVAGAWVYREGVAQPVAAGATG